MNTRLHGAIDLHSNNSMVVLLNETDKVIYKKRLKNDLSELHNELAPYKAALHGIVVESTYNWYWQVDGLQEADYKVHLANTSSIQSYKGLKNSDDKDDAIWLARLLRLGILAEGHIYPKEKRGVRELLHRRMLLVRQQTMSLLGVPGMVTRYEKCEIDCR